MTLVITKVMFLRTFILSPNTAIIKWHSYNCIRDILEGNMKKCLFLRLCCLYRKYVFSNAAVIVERWYITNQWKERLCTLYKSKLKYRELLLIISHCTHLKVWNTVFWNCCSKKLFKKQFPHNFIKKAIAVLTEQWRPALQKKNFLTSQISRSSFHIGLKMGFSTFWDCHAAFRRMLGLLLMCGVVCIVNEWMSIFQ